MSKKERRNPTKKKKMLEKGELMKKQMWCEKRKQNKSEEPNYKERQQSRQVDCKRPCTYSVKSFFFCQNFILNNFRISYTITRKFLEHARTLISYYIKIALVI